MVPSDDDRVESGAKEYLPGGTRASSTAADQSLSPTRCDPLGPIIKPPPNSQLPATLSYVEVGGSSSLGKFRLLKSVGHGAFGEVFRAYDTELDRYVAIKLPRPGTVSSTEEALVLHEAKSVSRLKHPGIVPVFDVGRTDFSCYIISEFVEGPTLARELQNRRFTFREAAELVAQIADALEYAHGEGIIHRDLKPSNILLEVHVAGSSLGGRQASATAGPRFVPRIVDFGLGKRSFGGASISGEKEVLGTPAYMSPEQAAGQSFGVDGRSDIYSLGVIFYQLLTGDAPFRGEISTLLERVIHEPPRSPRVADRSLPRDLEVICLKCLAKSAHDRYATAGELAADIRRWLEGMPIQARPTSRFERSWRWCRRRPAVAAMIALTLLVTTVGGVAVVVQWRGKQAAGQQAATVKIDRLIDAPSSQLHAALAAVRESIDTLAPQLRERLRVSGISERAQMRLQLALLPEMPELAESLMESMLTTADAHEFVLLRSQLSPFASRLEQRLIRRRQQAGADAQAAVRPLLALLEYGELPQSNASHAQEIARGIIELPPDEVAVWTQAATRVRPELTPALETLFADEGQTAAASLAAARALATLHAAEPEALVQLLLKATPSQHAILIEALQPHREKAVQLLRQITPILPRGGPDTSAPLPRKQASILCALVQLRDEQDIWPQLGHQANPSVQSYFIHTAAESGLSPAVLARRLSHEQDEGVLYAVILTLGTYSEAVLRPDERGRLIPELCKYYENHPDAGVHSAARWLLARWGAEPQLQAIDQRLLGKVDPERNWFVNRVGQTMIVIHPQKPGGRDDPISDEELGDTSSDAWRHVRWTYAIAATETTWSEFWQFKPAYESGFEGKFEHDSRNPAFGISVPLALEYCRWLSERDARTSANQAVSVAAPGQFVVDLAAPGYRLPLDVEWQRACRAGTSTSRFYGEKDQTLAAGYVQGSRLRKHGPVAAKMPNRYGLFDTLGNVSEYTLDWVDEHFQLVPEKKSSLRRIVCPDLVPPATPQADALEPTRLAMLGGSFWYGEADCSPDERLAVLAFNWQKRETSGFRVVRTIRMPRIGRPRAGDDIPQQRGN